MGAVNDLLAAVAVAGFVVYLARVMFRLGEANVEAEVKSVTELTSDRDRMILERKHDGLPDTFWQAHGYSYDWVFVFKVTDERTELPRERKKYSLRNILERVQGAGLDAAMFYSTQRDEVYCKIRAPLARLEEEASATRYKMEMDPEAIEKMANEGRMHPEESGLKGYLWKPVKLEDPYKQSPYPPFAHAFAPFSNARQDLAGAYRPGPSGTPFRSVDRIKLMASIFASARQGGGCGLDLDMLVATGCLEGCFPMHDDAERVAVSRAALKPEQLPWQAPLDVLKDYLGENVGMYLAFLAHYTTWLCGLAGLGVACWVDVLAEGDDGGGVLVVPFAAAVAVWAALLMQFWRRDEAAKAMKWGVAGTVPPEKERYQWNGTLAASPIDGSQSRYVTANERYARMAKSVSVLAMVLAATVALIAAVFALKATLWASTAAKMGTVYVASAIPSFLHAVVVNLMNTVYEMLAVYLNDMENHRTDIDYQGALIFKTVVFQSINSYGALFYIAFMKGAIGDECVGSCLAELREALGAIFVVNLVLGNLLEVAIPFIRTKQRKEAEEEGADPDRAMSLIELQYIEESYDTFIGPYKDYAELAVQFGYAVFFAAAFPLAPFMALCSNMLEMKLDVWKMLHQSRRPEPTAAESIGAWQPVFDTMACTAITTNMALVCFTSPVFEDMSHEARLGAFVLAEHVLFAAKLLIDALVPDVARGVQIQLARSRFLASKIVDDAADDDNGVFVTVDPRSKQPLHIDDKDVDPAFAMVELGL